MQPFGKIEAPWWDDKPVAIVGGGHSLQGFDFNKLREFHVLAVKGTIFDLPWADAGIGLDRPRYEEWEGRLGSVGFPVYWAVPEANGHAVRLEASRPSNVIFIERMAETEKLSEDQSKLSGGGTSGFASLGLAVLKRAKRIGLFGFDYNAVVKANFRRNDEHYIKPRAQSGENWKLWASYYNNIVPDLNRLGVKVINGSIPSIIRAFPRMDPNEAVEHLRRL